MSSYQHQCMLGNITRDSRHDYLTCGYCAKEFLLDNITLFIAHKTGGCDHGSHSRSATHQDTTDTSSPLTCSTCSRVFMTARGLLHHVQKDHHMVLCLQKGPLYLQHKEIRPPPAHLSCNCVDSARTHTDHHVCRCPSSVSSCGQTDQPTDLSMTCSNSMGKARVTCNEDKCQITIQPTCSFVSLRSESALPKKRKFVCQQQSVGFDREVFVYPGDGNSGSGISNDYDDIGSKDSFDHHPETASGKEADDNGVSICVTAEYQKDTLCCVSLSTEKKEHDKHAKLKRLLQNTDPVAEVEDLLQQGSDAKTTVIYKVPFLASPNPESAFLKATACESSEKDGSYHGCYIAASTDDAHLKSPKLHKSNNVSRLTVETNTDRLIRSSISSGSVPKELEILSLQPDSSGTSSRQPMNHRINEASSPTPSSPRLLMPGDKTASPSQNYISCATLDGSEMNNFISSTKHGSEKNNFISSTEHWNNLFLGGSQINQVPQEVTSMLPSPFLAVKSLPIGITQKEKVKLKNCLSLAEHSVPVSGKATLNMYSDLPALVNHQSDYPSNQAGDNSKPLDGRILRFLGQEKPSRSNKPHSKLLEPSMSVMADLTGISQPLQQWMNIQSDNGTGPTLRPKVSEHLDTAMYESGDQSSADTLDDVKLDHRALNRRRYPTSRPFKCPNCDQAFNQRIHLKKHMSKHTGVKPFKCQQCDYSTVERSHLKVHYRIHTGEKPYRCMFCDYATAQNSTLKIHMKRHHEAQLTSDFSSLKENNHQPTGSCDDDCWTLQDNVFVHSSLNNPAFDDELSRASFLSGSRTAHSLPAENASLENWKGDGDTRRRSSSPTTSAADLFFETSMQQSQSDSVTGQMSFKDTEYSLRKNQSLTTCGHYDDRNDSCFDSIIVKNTHGNPSITEEAELRFSTAEKVENLDCHNSEDSVNFKDTSEPGISKETRTSPVHTFVIQNKNKLQQNVEELDYFSSKTQSMFKSSAKRKQVTKLGHVKIIKSMKSQASEAAVSVNEKDAVKEKEPTPVVNFRVRCEDETPSKDNEVNVTGSVVSQKSMTANRMLGSELLAADLEDSGDECNSVEAVSVTIPSKAFVRG